tara:strand:- start:5025 stop:5297 length:273 start_codon:yes stop_codon:yes gene_type:complete
MNDLFHYDIMDEHAHDWLAKKGHNAWMEGDSSKLYGDCSNLTGDPTGLSGRCTGLSGHCTGLIGDLNLITKKQRKAHRSLSTYTSRVRNS